MATANVALLAFWMVASGAYSVFLGKDLNFDLRNYHLYNPHALLAGRIGRDIAPASIQTFLNPLLDIPFYAMVRSLPAALVGFVIGAFQGINGWLTTVLVRRALAHRGSGPALALALCAGLAGYLGAMNRMEIGTVFGDNIVSLFVLGALLLLDPFREAPRPGRLSGSAALAAAGILVGMSAGLKMTMVPYCIAFAVAVPFVAGGGLRGKFLRFALAGVSLAAGFVLTAGYWMVIMHHRYQSPLFPFFNRFFHSEYFTATNFADGRFLPRGAFQTLFYPFYFARTNNLVFELVFRDLRLGVTYLLLAVTALAAAVRFVRPGSARGGAAGGGDAASPRRTRLLFLALFVVASYAVWQVQFSIYRYLLPLEFLSIALIVLLLDRLLEPGRVFAGAAAVLLAVIALTVKAPNLGRMPWEDEYVTVTYDKSLDLENAVVVLDKDPLSYLIPYFPRSTTFLKVEGWFFGMSPRLKRDAQALLSRSDRPVYAVVVKSSLGEFGRALREYGQVIETDQCSPLVATGYPRGLVICRATGAGADGPPGKPNP